MDLLLNLNKERGTTLIIVTHDPNIAAQTQRVIRLIDGLLDEESNGSVPKLRTMPVIQEQAEARNDAGKGSES
jgi:ABC-type lipoprotein export system ATPase subunit